MRRSIALSATMLLAACATRPQELPTVPGPLPQPTIEQPGLAGLTAAQLVGRFGNPALQVREGASLKLQFRGTRCVLDAYLYPTGANRDLKVTHVDTRLPSGGDVDQAACIFSLRRAS